MKLKDQAAIVTGAGSGQGRAVAVKFAADGATVAIVDINYRGARDLAAGFAGPHRSNTQAPRGIGKGAPPLPRGARGPVLSNAEGGKDPSPRIPSISRAGGWDKDICWQ